jgi:sodium-dependent dicarboxylate transporter 2/3/5
MAFMLPVATPPNAIVFGTSRVTMKQMARTGLLLNFAGAILITLLMYFWGPKVFGFTM